MNTDFNISNTKLLASLLGLALLALFSCEGDSPEHQEEAALRDKVYTVHDAAMPKMSELHRLKKQLRKLPKETVAEGSEAQKKVANVMDMLEKADNGMMSWMNAFKEPAKLRKSMTHEEIMKYLVEEETTITNVNTEMDLSMDAARKLLDSLSAK